MSLHDTVQLNALLEHLLSGKQVAQAHVRDATLEM